MIAQAKKYLRIWFVAVPVVGIIFGFALFYSTQLGALLDILLVTVVAFLVSDALSILFFRGGQGIFQITLLGTRTQPKGYAFIVYFLTIPVSALVVDWLVGLVTEWLSPNLASIMSGIAVGLALAVLIYLDMNAKMYAR